MSMAPRALRGRGRWPRRCPMLAPQTGLWGSFWDIVYQILTRVVCHWGGGRHSAFPKGRRSPQMMTLLRRQEGFTRTTFLLFIQLLQQILISYHQGSEARGKKAGVKSQTQSRCLSGLKCLLKINVKWNNILQQNCPVYEWAIWKADLQCLHYNCLIAFQTDWSNNTFHIL